MVCWMAGEIEGWRLGVAWGLVDPVGRLEKYIRLICAMGIVALWIPWLSSIHLIHSRVA